MNSSETHYKTAITYGTFDLFHVGHLNLLERISKMADRLIVAVSTDEFNTIKGKKVVVPFRDRARIVGALACVDMVIGEQNWDQKRADILREKADLFVMGDDWAAKFDDLADICTVKYIGRTPGISTTLLKRVKSL